MSTPAANAKEQWLAFADRLIALTYAVFGEAKIEITEKLFGEPKILALALLCRTLGNFKGVIACARESLIVETRTLTRSCYENLYCMAALIDQGDDFVKAMHQDQMRSFRSQAEFLLEDIDNEHIGDTELVEQLRAVKEIKARWPKANFLTPKQTVKDSVLRQSYLIYRKLSGDAAHPSILALKRHLVRFPPSRQDRAFLPSADIAERLTCEIRMGRRARCTAQFPSSSVSWRATIPRLWPRATLAPDHAAGRRKTVD